MTRMSHQMDASWATWSTHQADKCARRWTTGRRKRTNPAASQAQRVRGHLLVTWVWCVGTGGAMGAVVMAVAWMAMRSVPAKNEKRRTASQTRCKQCAMRVPTAPRTMGHLKAPVGVRCVQRRCKTQTSPRHTTRGATCRKPKKNRVQKYLGSSAAPWDESISLKRKSV